MHICNIFINKGIFAVAVAGRGAGFELSIIFNVGTSFMSVLALKLVPTSKLVQALKLVHSLMSVHFKVPALKLVPTFKSIHTFRLVPV